MQRFACTCGQPLFFESSHCEQCGQTVGFDAETFDMHPLTVAHKRCSNGEQYEICNWLVPKDADDTLCVSCSLTRTIPDLAHDDNLSRWQRLETAKRRLIYTLLCLRAPIVNRDQDPDNGLAFEFREDRRSNPAVEDEQVTTGHASGVITVDLLEADPVERERARAGMNEQYRTLLGHMRHESGHYYWDRLVRFGPYLEEYRQRFGDERQDYAQALSKHYDSGPPNDWVDSYISAYASSHPWEDWAETWAHYLHMVDTLETARAFNVIGGQRETGLSQSDVGREIAAWMGLSVVMNELNRSMGADDTYPFVLSPLVVEKLQFVHRVLSASRVG